MKQYIISEQKLRDMLEDAFNSGYESPAELINQEVDRICKESKLSGVDKENDAPKEDTILKLAKKTMRQTTIDPNTLAKSYLDSLQTGDG